MKGLPIRTTVLSVRIIPMADVNLRRALNLKEDQLSLGLITTDCDDVSYSALDEATKKAQVEVAYAKSMYGGSSNASTKLAGEFFGILAGPTPSEVQAGVDAAISYMENDCFFISADDGGNIVYFAHTISSTGTYLSSVAKIAVGEPLAYLIAPPLEAMYAIDRALKYAKVELRTFYGPPTETNFAGGLLTGLEADCFASCEEFATAVCEVADNPITRNIRVGE